MLLFSNISFPFIPIGNFLGWSWTQFDAAEGYLVGYQDPDFMVEVLSSLVVSFLYLACRKSVNTQGK